MSTSEAAVATFQRGVVGIQPGTITAASVEHGYQRSDGREQFGFRDGLRNVASDRREAVIFVDPDNQPEEPSWANGGSYMAYMKIRQNLDAATQLGQAAMEQVIGRRMSDGSRLDLPEGTDPRTESVFTNPNVPPLASHIRKAGPRDAIHDLTEIFRRGIPYTELQSDGSLDAGLQFVSFQCMLDSFSVIFNRWMTNQNFPVQAAGTDSLFANNLVSIEKAGFYFVPPADSRFIGAGLFDAPVPDPCTLGRVIVHKQVLDQNSQPVLVDLGGFTFQIVDANSQAIGTTFQTGSAGHAESPDLQRGQTYTLEEVNPPTGFQTAPNQNFTLTQHRQILRVANQIQGAPPPYNP
jgi:Dyp-type peroxidase family